VHPAGDGGPAVHSDVERVFRSRLRVNGPSLFRLQFLLALLVSILMAFGFPGRGLAPSANRQPNKNPADAARARRSALLAEILVFPGAPGLNSSAQRLLGGGLLFSVATSAVGHDN